MTVRKFDETSDKMSKLLGGYRSWVSFMGMIAAAAVISMLVSIFLILCYAAVRSAWRFFL